MSQAIKAYALVPRKWFSDGINNFEDIIFKKDSMNELIEVFHDKILSYCKKLTFWINRILNANKFLTSISISLENALLFPWVWYAKLKFLFSKSKLSGFRTLSKHFWVSFCRMLWVWSPEVKLYLDPCMRSEKNFSFSNSRLFLLFSISWNAKKWK